MKKIVFLALCFFCILITNAQTISLSQVSTEVYCSNGIDSFSANWTNIPANSNIVFYQSTNPAFNPYLGQGDSIGFLNVGGNTSGGGGAVTTACPEILGIFIDACDQGGVLREVDNEYMVITSGNTGFNVSSLKIQMPNTSINVSSCPFGTPSAATMTQLRNGTCDATTLIAAGQADFIPANAIVIIFTGRGALYNYNFSSYCSSGQPIYILQNSCSPGTANFVNNAPSSCPGQYRNTTITVGSCTDKLTYNPCSLPPFNAGDPNANDGNYVIHLPNTDTSSVTNGGIRNNAADKCNGIRFDSISGTTIIKYPIPNDGSGSGGTATNFCNDGYHYIKAITHPNGTQPISNSIKFKLVCLDNTSSTTVPVICSGQNAVINNSSSDANATFSWTISGGTNITGAAAGNGTQINQTLTNTSAIKDSIIYSITASDAGCTSSKTIKIIVNPNSITPINIGNDTAYCGTFTRTLSTGNAATVWNNNVGIPSTTAAQITVTQPGKYWATITGTCGSVTDSINITQSSTQTPINIGKDTAYCGIFTRTLSTGNAATVWNNNVGIPSTTAAQITVTQPGKYWATITGTCGSVTDSINITQSSTQTPINIGNDTSYCGAFTRTLSTGNATTVWNNNVGIPSITAAQITVTQPGKYWATITGSCGSVTDSINITQISTPTPINIGNDTAYCGIFTRTLSTGNAVTVWNNNVSIPSVIAAQITVTQPGKYWATLTSSCGTVSDTINITQSAGINFSFGGNTTVCFGGNLDAGSGYSSYIWNTGATSQTISINVQGKYWVDVFKNGCKGSDSIFVTLNNKPNAFSLGKDSSFCDNFSFTLAAPAGNVVWNNNIGLPSSTGTQLTATKPGKYWATLSNSCGSVSDTIQLFQVLSPAAFSLGNDTAICGTFTKTISTGIPSTVWNNNVSIPPVTASQITISQIGKYWATVTNSCGKFTDTIEIKNGSNLLVNIGDTIRKCIGTSTVIDAGPGFTSYLWNTTAVSQSISVTNTGKYFVEVTKNACKGSDTVYVVDEVKPTINSLGNDTTYCGSFSQLLSTGDATTKWSTNATAAQITVNTGGTYIATITNQCGSIADTIVLKQNPLPQIELGNDVEICDSTQLSIGNGVFESVRWNTNDSVNAITVKDAGTYIVQVTDTNSCVKIDSVNVKKVCDYTIYLPTAFTPNNDGINDILVPLSKLKGIVILKFLIFDRWNEKVFESYNFAPGDLTYGWNGQLKNTEQQVDNYVFLITAKLPDNTTKDYKGIITLLR
jgi:gliding motility-associated-like protein